MNAEHVIFGAGAIGLATADALIEHPGAGLRRILVAIGVGTYAMWAAFLALSRPEPPAPLARLRHRALAARCSPPRPRGYCGGGPGACRSPCSAGSPSPG